MAFGATPPELGFRPLTLQYDLGPNTDPSFPEKLLPKECWKDRIGPWDPDVLCLLSLTEFIRDTDWDTIHTDLAAERPTLLAWDPSKPDYQDFVAGEILQLQLLMQTDRERYMGEIVAQHDNAPGYWVSLMAANNREHHYTLVIMNLAVRIGQIVAAFYKDYYKRPRPSYACPGLLPAFGPPAHASFPSGHSLQSWLMSLFLEEVACSYKCELEWLADRVAVNRERAGVHYRSDTEAGKFIAEKCKAKIMALPVSSKTKMLFEAAKTEWKPVTTAPAPAPV
ncbi:phosphatase PAP2 family protein [Bradyrhizobium sp. RP6]|uniref:phosphatase PAP2 family protein n=2 Tax=Bradyrhizobium TaxID=374 RepID=UPI0013158D79|nr:phosphatase PAP2 family protein [Bradyrhizobium sp. RP6]